MKKINGFLTVYIIIITVLCGYMYYVAFYKRDINKEKLAHQVQSTITEKEETRVTVSYQPMFQNDHLVIINTKTNEVFEYTDMKKSEVPESVVKMIQDKEVFYGQEEVYHFLESISS